MRTPLQPLGKHSRSGKPRRKVSAPLATPQNNYLLRRLLIYGLRSTQAVGEGGFAQIGKKMCGFCVAEQKKIPHNAGGFLIRHGAQTIERVELLRTRKFWNA